MPWHLRFHVSWCRRLPRTQRLSVGDDLLRNSNVRVGRSETTRTIQQSLGKPERQHEHPIRPGLRHHGVGLHPIEDFFSFLRGLLNLIRRRCVAESLIGSLKFFLQLFIFLLQRNQLYASILVFSKSGNRSCHFVRIHLREKIHFHDDDVTIESCGDLLIEHQHQPSGIGPDFIFGDIHIVNDGDAFQIGGNLFECVPFGKLGGQSDGIFPGIAVPHAMLTLSIDHPDISQRRGDDHAPCERE